LRAIIIAAGRGSRLGELTDDLPKCLMTVGGKTLLKRQIDSFRANGIQDISVVRGYQAEKIDLTGLRYFLNDDFKRNNILHSLMYAREIMDEGFVATYSDILFKDSVLSSLSSCSSDLAVVVDLDWKEGYVGRTEHPVEEAEKVVLDDDGVVQTIGKDISSSTISGEFIGMLKCTRAGAECFKEYFDRATEEYDLEAPFARAASFRNAYITDLLQYMVDDGVRVDSVLIKRGWQEIDVRDDLRRANQYESQDI